MVQRIKQTLRGLRAGSMSGLRSIRVGQVGYKDSSLGDSSFTAKAACTAFVFATGAGGSGGSQGGGVAFAGGGGGGAAGFKAIRLLPGQAITWTTGAGGAGATSTIGNPGSGSTVSYPGVTLIAGGGQGGLINSATLPAGGMCSGPWDIARSGGLGGAGIGGGTAGAAGLGGGAGGLAGSNFGGGGGAAGFLDMIDGGVFAGNGTAGNSTSSGAVPGGGSGGVSSTSGSGGDGRVIVFVIRTAL